MKNLFATALLAIAGLFVFTANSSVAAQSYTDNSNLYGGTLTVGTYIFKAPTTNTWNPNDTVNTSLNTTSGNLLTIGTDLTKTVSTDSTVSLNANVIDWNTASGSKISINTDPITSATNNTAIIVANTGSTSIQGSTTTTMPNTTTTPTSTIGSPQTTWYYGPPEFSTTNPAANGSLSGSNNTLSATISDPNNLVKNVRFIIYDKARNKLLETNATIGTNGKWSANDFFDSTKYADGGDYTLEITAQGDIWASLGNTRPTVNLSTLTFGIDNMKNNEIYTNFADDGSSIINKEFTSTAYQYIPVGDMPVTTTTVQYYYVDSLGTRIQQGTAQSLTKDPNPYNWLWSAPSLDSRTFFTKGNGRYIAVFTAIYADGDTKSKEVMFEVYNSNDVTPPVKPIILSPTDGITMKPGPITYKWTGNAADDVVEGSFESGSIEQDGSFVGRKGGPIPSEAFHNGSFTWTDNGDYHYDGPQTTNWRIKVKDRAGNWSEWSAVSSYTIDPNYVPDTTPPPKPTLLNPLNNQNVNGGRVLQSWKSAANDIDYYTYESYSDAQHKKLVTQEKILISSRTTLNQPNGSLWWRIQATDKSGNKSEWSDLIKMTISNVTTKK